LLDQFYNILHKGPECFNPVSNHHHQHQLNPGLANPRKISWLGYVYKSDFSAFIKMYAISKSAKFSFAQIIIVLSYLFQSLQQVVDLKLRSTTCCKLWKSQWPDWNLPSFIDKNTASS